MPTHMGSMRPRLETSPIMRAPRSGDIAKFPRGDGAWTFPAGIFDYQWAGTTTLERWYFAGQITAVAGTTHTPAADTLFAYPWIFPQGATLDRIGANVTTLSATDKFHVGIYSAVSGGRMYPDALIVDSGELDPSSTGVKSATISQVMTPGVLYFFVFLGKDSSTIYRAPSLNGMWNCLGVGSTLPTASGLGIFETQAYGALPSTFPNSAPAAITSSSVGVAYRIASIP